MSDSSTSDGSTATGATPFTSIVPGPSVSDADSSSSTDQNEKLSADEKKALSKYMFGALSFLLDSFPALDELGLILGLPSGVPASSESVLQQYHEQNGAPPPCYQRQVTQNGCPPFVVMEGTKLGIAFWSVPFLIPTAVARFQAIRATLAAATASASRDAAVQLVLQHMQDPQPLHTQILHCTRILVLVNADNYSAWNARKLLLSAQRKLQEQNSSASILTPQTELQLLNLVYSKHPKSGESWSHRRWVLSRIPGFDSQYHFETTSNSNSSNTHANSEKLPSSSASVSSTPVFDSEIRMCERSAELYPKNYYAWMHRQWLVERIDSVNDIRTELDRTSEWTESHINDYCGFFHRQVVWNRFMELVANVSTPSGKQRSKAEEYARAHQQLPYLLRSWSKQYPMNDFTSAVPSSSDQAVATATVASASSPSNNAASQQQQLHHALACCSFCSVFASGEWSHLNELQLRYPGHESLWMYRRFVWFVQIQAIQQHHEQLAGETAAVSSSDVPIPSWLQPLIHRELEYADFQIRDMDLENYEQNRIGATIYKVWVLHGALSLIYRSRTKEAANSSVGKTAASHNAITFPLFEQLSPAHRSWYAQLVQGVLQLPTKLMSHDHWQQRLQTLTASK